MIADFNQHKKLPGAMEAGSPAGLPHIPGEPLLQAVCVCGGVWAQTDLGCWTGRTSATGTSWGKKGLSFQLDLDQAREISEPQFFHLQNRKNE